MNVDFGKYADGLAPTIVQDAETGKVLMLGYVNAEALERTNEIGRVTFFSRSRRRLWTKGETSGNYLTPVSIATDCDSDALLIRAVPSGPVCHTGADTCFGESNRADILAELEALIARRRDDPIEGSYTSSLFAKGINKIAQKVGEEAIELVIEAKDDDRESFLNESADLVFHFLVLLAARNIKLKEVLTVLRERRTQ